MTTHNGTVVKCRICDADTFAVIDLGNHPFANNLAVAPELPVETFPLCLHVCQNCSAAQLCYCADDHALYDEYNYITPDSEMLREHYAHIVDFLKDHHYLGDHSHILEIGSNIGHFLAYVRPFVESVLGVDPARNISQMANQRGIHTLNTFFNADSAEHILQTHGQQDLIVARHCFAHNAKPGLILDGIVKLLSPEGVFLIENAYFLDTIRRFEFDQIYHEHMYYYNIRSIREIIKKYHLKLVDVYHSTIHGGTMMYLVQHESSPNTTSDRLRECLDQEKDMHQQEYYAAFLKRIESNKSHLQELLNRLIKAGKRIHAYGACAKSTTLLNYYGIDSALIPYIVDSTVTKHGKYIPIAGIKVISEEESQKMAPDYYLLTIWNYRDEVINKVRAWGNTHSRFILPHPEVEISNCTILGSMKT